MRLSLSPLCLPLAGATSHRGPLGIQSLASEASDGIGMILVNDSLGSTKAWWWSDEEMCGVTVIHGLESARREAALASLRALCGSVKVEAFLTLAQIRRAA